MAILKVDGKQITLPDELVARGPEAIRKVLASSGWPA
jgi:hypothetical protein